jgi:hypothetical protein
MRQPRWLLALSLVVVTAAAAPRPAQALLENAGRNSVERLKPILTEALGDASTKLTGAEDHLGVVGDNLLGHANGILERGIVQAKGAANDVTDHALAGVDALAKTTLKEAQQAGMSLLLGADVVIRKDISQLGVEVDGAVAKADQALAARIDQLDEVASRQLGNVDVIASKQQFGLEETGIHIAVMVGIIVFIVFAFRRLLDKYDEELKTEASEKLKSGKAPVRGALRTWKFTKIFGRRFLGDLALAGAAVGILFILYKRLPDSAEKAEAALVTTQEQALADSLQRFDFTKVRFHASQLGYLRPANAARYQGLAAKADLLRDIIERPTLLATDAGVTQVWQRLESVRRLLSPAVDPDLLVVEAMLVWETGGSRREEQRAASLCAQAIRVGSSTSFILGPLARTYIDTFLAAPFVDVAAGVGRDSELPPDLRTIADAQKVDSQSPLSASLMVARLMRQVNARASSAYAAMVEAHAEVVRLLRDKGSSASDLDKARAKRKAAAQAVVTAWTDFDRALLANPELTRSPAVLAIFRLDDSTFTRAKWFLSRPDDEPNVAPLLSSSTSPPPGRPGKTAASSGGPAATCGSPLPKADQAAMRLVLAPPRVVWARRYRALFDGPGRPLFEAQETDRFAASEQLEQRFECDMVVAKAKATPPAADLDTAAIAAAELGLYVGDADGGPRTPYARQLVAKGGSAKLDEALAMRGIRLF